MATIAVQTDGVIEAGKCYPIATFRTLAGMGPAAIREARKKGFLVRRVGLRSFVLGQDLLDYVRDHGKPVE